MLDWNKKEKPLLGLLGSGGGLGFFGGIQRVDYDEVIFTSSSSGSWTAPDDAAKTGISIVLISKSIGGGGGGNGGGLSWGNNIPVVSGQSYPWSISNSGTRFGSAADNILFATQTGNQGNFAQGGGNGGNGGSYINAWHADGGGGAGGYDGDGGEGQGGQYGTGGPGGGTAGQGGGGGGGTGSPSQQAPGGIGGGTGIFGQGPSGAFGGVSGSILASTGSQSSPYQSHGFGGSSGKPSASQGGPTWTTDGVIRIIWGGIEGERQFPTTNVNYSPNYN
jgi:hypothetical protein